MFTQQEVPQPPIVQWVDPDHPGVVGTVNEQNGRVVVEYGSETARGFINVPLQQIPGIVAALTAMHADLGTLEPEGA